MFLSLRLQPCLQSLPSFADTHFKELSLFIVFLETTSKLTTFSERSIKLLVGIYFEFFTPVKLTEIQRRIDLSCHIALRVATQPEYSSFVVKSSSLIKKLGKFNGAETKVMNGSRPGMEECSSDFVNELYTDYSPGVVKITIDHRNSVTKSEWSLQQN